MHGQWTDDEAIAFLCAVCKAAGDEDPAKRRTSVLEARAKAAAGDPFTGWPRLGEIVDARIVGMARDLLFPRVDISALQGVFDGAPPADPDDPLNEVNQGKKQKIGHDQVCFFLSQSAAWQGVFRFNVLSRRHVAVRPRICRLAMETDDHLSDGDVGKIRNWFSSQGYSVGSTAVREAVATICEEKGRGYNPFAEYLDSLAPASGNLALTHLTIFKVQDPLASVLLTKTLVAAVRRARAAPAVGEKIQPVDHQGVLVLSGAQGVGKGRLVKILGGDFYSSVDISRLKDKDTTIKIQGSVLVELEEMSTSGAQDRDALKRFLSAADDHERAAFGRGAVRVSRSYAMIATTNDARLEDPTGHRRMWPIVLTPGQFIDHEAATQLRDALWSEANALAATDYDHHLTPAEAARCADLAKGLEAEDSVHDSITDALCGRTFVTIRQVYDEMTRGSKKDDLLPRREQLRISDGLRRIGCVMSRPVINGLEVRGWEVPSLYAGRTLSEEGQCYRNNLLVAEGLRAATRN